VLGLAIVYVPPGTSAMFAGQGLAGLGGSAAAAAVAVGAGAAGGGAGGATEAGGGAGGAAAAGAGGGGAVGSDPAPEQAARASANAEARGEAVSVRMDSHVYPARPPRFNAGLRGAFGDEGPRA